VSDLLGLHGVHYRQKPAEQCEEEIIRSAGTEAVVFPTPAR